MTTKPYIAGSGYVRRMSDYCGGCAFHPERDCPLTRLYWAYLDRHRDRLAGNQRLAMPLRTLDRRDRAERRRDAAVFDHVRTELAAARPLQPSGIRAILEPRRGAR